VNLTDPIKDKFVAVVDDDTSLCRALARLLTAGGIQSRCYPSAEAFLEDHDNSGPDCLVLDLQLGGMSGFELQRELMARGRVFPTIFITADNSVEAREQAQSAGCEGFFLKTDPGDAILWAVRRVLSVISAG
jgi:FixJ family two-component response regulator